MSGEERTSPESLPLRFAACIIKIMDGRFRPEAGRLGEPNEP